MRRKYVPSERDKEVTKMRALFMDIWSKRKHYSEISGQYLGKEPLSIYFHHILPKSKWDAAKYDEENIILLTGEEHDNVEIDMYRYEEINNRREKLIQKYEGA
jgi:uncharacterized protein YvpB